MPIRVLLTKNPDIKEVWFVCEICKKNFKKVGMFHDRVDDDFKKKRPICEECKREMELNWKDYYG